ncbi:hypothetical protein BXT86_02230 [candidate division WOR-3 bacterium 4484_100]|uniref:DNA mismatch repair proteins mutS family domain-containing protein n=1 Tax=candidate division WOR-3 bacterium 4484_100 TaxID=1936077 RepID=A0A1V4QGV2_UNCW3|nr:MAG: hypothetical protein BXT86_02230 [candidate division WOR-3 bacterium 4484_100]
MALGLMPLDSRAQVEAELERVQKVLRTGKAARFYLPFGPGELEQTLRKVRFLNVEQLLKIKGFLESIDQLKKEFKNSSIKNYFNKLYVLPEITNEIIKKIDPDGFINDNASPKLSSLRRQIRQVKSVITKKFEQIIRKQRNYLIDDTVVQRNGRYVLPVKTNFKRFFKGVIHSYSNSGEAVFIEPLEITDDSARLEELKAQEQQEIEIILSNLTAIVRQYVKELESNIQEITELDLLFAKAEFARSFGAHRPIFGEYIDIRKGFHPILKQIETQVVPLDLRMDRSKRVLLISGPNAGGKTVVLKTVGLIALMAQCGLFIPAEEGTMLPFFKGIYADIGDEQSIESHLSTFSAHLQQIKEALSAREYSLVLLDELMSQTSIEEGSALAQAILEAFAEKGDTVIATTHNEDLKIYVSNQPEMMNGGMEFTDRPTYRLILGIPQPSNAIRLAEQLGLDPEIVEKARAFLSSEKVSINELYTDLSKRLNEITEEKKKLDKLVEEYKKKLEQFNAFKHKEIEQLREKYRARLIQAKKDIEHLIQTLRSSGPRPNLVHKAREFFEKNLESEQEIEPYFPEIGELVKLRQTSKIGQVIEQKKGRYKISLQNIYYWVKPQEIEPVRK